ncbi:MAG: sodium:solute symporter, partial [Clostridia bacterium]|nr:sodium:solute symporter [Clostridia bacterium]
STMRTMRMFIAVFILISAVLAIVQAKSNITFIAQLMGISWGALAGAFLAPFLYGLYWKRVTKAAVWVSFAFGTGFMILQMILSNTMDASTLPFMFQSSINAGAFVMLASLLIVPLVSLITKKPSSENIAQIFSCYAGQVTVSSSKALPDEKIK